MVAVRSLLARGVRTLGTQSFPDRHKDIIEALTRKDAELAALAMERDVAQGMEQVSQGLDQGS